MKNYLVLPAFYEGTSFEDIANSIKDCLFRQNFDVKVIGLKTAFENDLLSDILEDNRFFDVQQMIIKELLQEVSSSSKILFLDFFFPGLDLIKFFFERNNITVKTGALLHGGVFLTGDIQSGMDWFRNTEKGYFDIFDVVYSPSEFLLNKCPNQYQTKIKVFPWGLDSFDVSKCRTEDKNLDIIFPHRLAADKGISELIEICEKLPEIEFYITAPQLNEEFITPDYRRRLLSLPNVNFIFNESAKDHAYTLASSKLVLSCAKQENFGYAVHKSILSGCIPILPKGLCYDEFISPEYIYENVAEAVLLIKKWHEVLPAWELKQIYKTTNNFTFSDLLNDFYG